MVLAALKDLWYFNVLLELFQIEISVYQRDDSVNTFRLSF
jgi:hypothetical protein